MELSKFYNLKLYGKCVRVGANAPVSIERREKWLVEHLKMTPAKAHDIVNALMTQAIMDAAKAWWDEEIPDDKDLITWIDRRYDIILFEYLDGGDLS